MIFFDDAFSQRESQSPAALLGGEARTEHVADVFLANALACVAHLDDGALGRLFDVERDAAGTFHGIDGILAEVLDDPFEERSVESHDDIVSGEVLHHLHLLRRATVHVVHHMVHHVIQTRRHGLGQRTNLRETVGNELQALHVLVHFGY